MPTMHAAVYTYVIIKAVLRHTDNSCTAVVSCQCCLTFIALYLYSIAL